MAWYFKDEANAYAKTVRRSLSEAGAVVPALWPLEVAMSWFSVIWKNRLVELAS
jgi:hypothetical protein